jgi:hypothetical protein
LATNKSEDRERFERKMYEDLPEALKGAKDYLVKAEQFKNLDPVVSVYCKVYALDLVTKTLDRSDKSAVSFLLQLMEQVEKEKKALGHVEDPQQQVALALVLPAAATPS